MVREYRTATTRLEEGAMIVCYTDGLVAVSDLHRRPVRACLLGAAAAAVAISAWALNKLSTYR